MKITLTAVLLALLASGSETDIPYEHTQSGMNETACRSAVAAEESLATLAATFREGAADNAALLAAFDRSEAAWHEFTESQLHRLYGTVDTPSFEYGSVWLMRECGVREELALLRAGQLERLIERNEGDACSWFRGSAPSDPAGQTGVWQDKN